MKKIISIVIAAACVLALFAGCSAKAPEAEAPKKAGGKKKAAAAKGNRNLDDEIPF